jgi:hypothetical protein
MTVMSFEAWMAEVDVIFERTVSLSVHDVPDIDWRALYEELEPEEAVEYYMENFGY